MKQRKQFSRREFLKLASVAAFSGALVSCSKAPATPVSDASSDEPEAVVATVQPMEDVEITVIMYGNILTENDPGAPFYTEFLMELNDQGKGVHVSYEPYPGGTEYNTKLRMMTAADEFKDHIFFGNWQPISECVLDSLILPIDDLMAAAGVSADEWIPATVAQMRYDPLTRTAGEGKMWALPYQANSGAAFIFTNVDMVKAAGEEPPTDDSTALDLERIATAVAKPDQGIFGMQSNLWGTTHSIGWDQSYVAPFGGYVLDETGTKCLINSDACVESYKWEYDIRHVKHIAATPDEVTAYGNYSEGSLNNKLAMFRMGGWGGQRYRMRPENANPEMTFCLVPASYDGRADGRRGNNLTHDYYAIAARSQHPDAAFTVLQWMTGHEAALFMAKALDSIMPRFDLLNDPALDDMPVSKKHAAAVLAAEIPQSAANLRDTEINDLMAQRFQTVDTGETVPDKAFLDSLAEEIQAILDMPKP